MTSADPRLLNIAFGIFRQTPRPNQALAQLCRATAELPERWRVGVLMDDDRKERTQRRERHAREVEASQKALRESISETERLVGESEKMLRRHRQEREEGGEE